MRISLCGGPGCGKDTIASGIFHKMKIDGYNVEMVTEYVKQWTYIDRKPDRWNQLYLFGHQWHREYQVIQGGFEHLVTSSPILLSCFYAYHYNSVCTDELLSMAKKFEEEYPALHILLDRKDLPYDTRARFETAEQAKQIDAKLMRFLEKNVKEFMLISAKNIDTIYEIVKASIDGQKA